MSQLQARLADLEWVPLPPLLCEEWHTKFVLCLPCSMVYSLPKFVLASQVLLALVPCISEPAKAKAFFSTTTGDTLRWEVSCRTATNTVPPLGGVAVKRHCHIVRVRKEPFRGASRCDDGKARQGRSHAFTGSFPFEAIFWHLRFIAIESCRWHGVAGTCCR